MKTLFKPSLLKIVTATLLFIVFSWLWQITFGLVIMDVSYYGVPLHFFVAWGPCQAGQNCSEFNALYLVVDIIFWYVVGAILVFRFQKK
jgi:hypothetical protein